MCGALGELAETFGVAAGLEMSWVAPLTEEDRAGSYRFIVTAYSGLRDTPLYETAVTIVGIGDLGQAYIEALKMAQRCTENTCAARVGAWTIRHLEVKQEH